MRRAAVLLVIAAACTQAPRTLSAPVATRLTAADSARCAAVADSMLTMPPHELPLTRPVGDDRPPRAPRPPLNAAAVVIQTMFVVRPDGTADTATVTIRGTEDTGYRRAMTRFLSRQRFEVPVVEGCPAWSRGDIIVTGIIERVPRRSPD